MGRAWLKSKDTYHQGLPLFSVGLYLAIEPICEQVADLMWYHLLKKYITVFSEQYRVKPEFIELQMSRSGASSSKLKVDLWTWEMKI